MQVFYRFVFISGVLCVMMRSAVAGVVEPPTLMAGNSPATIASVKAGSIVNDGSGTAAGDVYDWTLWEGYKTSGIASVAYVNRAVDAAGNAAQWAENHAALAADIATQAKNVASSAQSVANSAQNTASAAKAAVDAIVVPTVNNSVLKIQKNGTTIAEFSANSANAVSANIILGALADLNTVSTGQIADSSVTSAKLASGAVATANIANGAVTAAKTSGVYGYLPAGSDKSGVAEIWVE